MYWLRVLSGVEGDVLFVVGMSFLLMLRFIDCWLVLRASWIYHFDAEQAFVQSNLEDVFMRAPQGCGEMSGMIVRLNRSLYGLNQTPRSWHNHLMRMKKSLDLIT